MKMCFARPLFAVAAVLLSATAQATLIPVANFNLSSGSLQSGQAVLQAVDPQGKSKFVTDTVFGKQQQVYRFDSSSGSKTQQAGLQLATHLLVSNVFSVDLVFKLDHLLDGYQRLFDVSARSSNDGVFARSGQIYIYPTSASASAKIIANEYNRLTMTHAGNGSVSAYLNGTWLYDTSTNALDFSQFSAENPHKLMSFFLNNTNHGWTAGQIASLRLYDQALSASDVMAIGNSTPLTPAVPAPTPALLLFGASLLLLRRRTR